MYLYHPFHLPHFHLARTGPLLAHAALRRFALSMVSLFSPVYIYQVFKGGNASTHQAAAAAIAFFAVLFLAKAVALPLALRQTSSRGLRWVLIMATLPLFFFFAALVLLTSRPIILLLSSFLWGISAAFFWAGYHGCFVHLGDGDHFGEEVGLAHVLDISAGFLAPLVGGVVVQQFGFFWLFAGAGMVLVISLFPLFRVDHRDSLREFSAQEGVKLIFSHPRAALAYLGAAGSAALNISIWPLYIFLLFGSAMKLGMVTAVAVIIAGVVTILVGLWTDRLGKLRLIKGGSLGSGTFWLTRIVARSVPAVVGIDVAYRIFERVLWVPLDALTYQKAQEGRTGLAIFFREVVLSFSAAWILVITALLLVSGVPLTNLFAFGALFSVGPLLLWSGREGK